MKKLIIGMCAFFLLGSISYAQEELMTEFSSETKDYKVSELGQVSVIQKTITLNEIPWTLDEIDYYIKMVEMQMAEIQKQMKNLMDLRENIEDVAKKVKLSQGQEET